MSDLIDTMCVAYWGSEGTRTWGDLDESFKDEMRSGMKDVLCVAQNCLIKCFYDQDLIKCFYDQELPNKFIALYSDGSGCEMYFKKGVNWYPIKDTEDCFGGVDKQWFTDAGYLWFIALPDDFKVWGEEDAAS